jgi:hypothetical protein
MITHAHTLFIQICAFIRYSVDGLASTVPLIGFDFDLYISCCTAWRRSVQTLCCYSSCLPCRSVTQSKNAGRLVITSVEVQ